jgi:hypothetical protein
MHILEPIENWFNGSTYTLSGKLELLYSQMYPHAKFLLCNEAWCHRTLNSL